MALSSPGQQRFSGGKDDGELQAARSGAAQPARGGQVGSVGGSGCVLRLKTSSGPERRCRQSPSVAALPLCPFGEVQVSKPTSQTWSLSHGAEPLPEAAHSSVSRSSRAHSQPLPPPGVVSAIGLEFQTAATARPATWCLVATCCGLNCVPQNTYSSPQPGILFGNRVKRRS